MKRTILLLTLFAVTVGCNEPKGAEQQETEQELAITNNNIAGEWEATCWHRLRTVDGKITVDRTMEKGEFVGVKHVFQSDGTGSEFNDFNGGRWYELFIFKWVVEDNKIRFPYKADGSSIINGEIVIDPVVYFSETDWTVHKLTSKELTVSYTRVMHNPELVAKGIFPDEQEHHTFTYEKVK